VGERTGLPHASTARSKDEDGNDVPVMQTCGHDVHVTCLLDAAALLANGRGRWQSTVIAVFQPAEETGDGARGLVGDELAETVGRFDVALGQHVLPLPSGSVGTRAWSVLSASDSMRVVYGRLAHGSMLRSAIDPVVLAAMIVVRLQTAVAREVAPTNPAVLTVGSIHAGTKSNVIGRCQERGRGSTVSTRSM
jgi:metal-dependent amidase/aminoacylase/carboxypeptidase family protein